MFCSVNNLIITRRIEFVVWCVCVLCVSFVEGFSISSLIFFILIPDRPSSHMHLLPNADHHMQWKRALFLFNACIGIYRTTI